MEHVKDKIRMSAKAAQDYNREISKIVMSDEQLVKTNRRTKETQLSFLIHETQLALQDAGMKDPKFDLKDIQLLSDKHLNYMLSKYSYRLDLTPGDEEILLRTIHNLSDFAKKDYGMEMDKAEVKLFNKAATEYAMSDAELAVSDREKKLENLLYIISVANDAVASAGHSRLSLPQINELFEDIRYLSDEKLNELLSEDFLPNNIDPNPWNKDYAIIERKKVEHIIDHIYNETYYCKCKQETHERNPEQQRLIDKLFDCLKQRKLHNDKAQDMDP